MPERSIRTILNESFPKSNKEDWLRLASQELNGNNSPENLIWKIDDLNFFPYYDQQDLKDLEYLKGFQTPPYRLPHSEPGSWQNLPKITVSSEKNANALALQYLETGGDGILFDITGSTEIDLDQLLEKIYWPSCNISFIASTDGKIAGKILEHVNRQNYDPLLLSGSLFWKQSPENRETLLQQLSPLKKFHSLGIVVPSSTSVEEISKSLQQGVLYLDYLTNMGIEKEDAFRNISLSLFCEENFFATIAKFRALRILWYQLSQAFEVVRYEPSHLHLHACSKKWAPEKFQPQANMIKMAPAALASVLGGCDALTLCAEDESNVMMNRVALHVSNILKEESHVDKTADAIAGSYAIENMVNKLSQAAWKDFQNKIRSHEA